MLTQTLPRLQVHDVYSKIESVYGFCYEMAKALHIAGIITLPSFQL